MQKSPNVRFIINKEEARYEIIILFATTDSSLVTVDLTF